MKKRALIIDNGHGKDTAGKRSPIRDNGTRLFEWCYNRQVAKAVEQLSTACGYDVFNVCEEDTDTPFATRRARANAIADRYGAQNCAFVSIHGNAAGSGGWYRDPKTGKEARGWQVFHDGKNAALAQAFQTTAAEMIRPPLSLRSVGTANFAIYRGLKCPAVLTENFFYDNEKDCAFMDSVEGVEFVALLHLNAINRFFAK